MQIFKSYGFEMPYDKLRWIDVEGKEILLVNKQCPNEKCYKRVWTIDSDRLSEDYKGGGPNQYFTCHNLIIEKCFKLEDQ
jgi:hypothetical protein